MLLIGSRALVLRAPAALSRKPQDFDWVCTQEEYEQWMEKNSSKLNITKQYYLPEFHKQIVEGDTNLEFEIVVPGSSSELLTDLVNKDPDTIETPFGKIPSLDMLFAIKDAHKYKKFNFNSNGFWKTATDWHMMKSLGAKIRPEYEAFSKMRQDESYVGQRHPKLNVSKEDFFKDDGIQYVYQHDDIHEAVKLLDKPAYRYYMKEGSEVLSDKNKFLSSSKEIQLAGCIEEASTLAIERSLVPSPGAWTPKFAWQFALAKTSTSITSGFFRKYIFENIFEIIKMYPTDYWDRFQAALAAGQVRPFTGSKY